MDDGLEGAYLAVEEAYGQGEFSTARDGLERDQLAEDLQCRSRGGHVGHRAIL